MYYTFRIEILVGVSVIALAVAVWALVGKVRALSAERARLESEVAALGTKLTALRHETTLTDAITGVKNRRFFATTIEGDVERVRRSLGRPDKRKKNRDLVFYVVDLDNLREVNEQFGQDAGDRVIAEVASRLTEKVRKSDSIVRWGGEEFLIVCRNCERADGRVVADRILSAVSNEPFDLGRDRLVKRSCSIGWTHYPWLMDSPDAVSWEDILRLAERALGIAKKGGRNQGVGLTPSGLEAESVAEARDAIENPLKSGDWRSIRLVRSLGREEKSSPARERAAADRS